MSSGFVSLASQLIGANSAASAATPALEEVTKLIDASQQFFHQYDEKERTEFHSWIPFSSNPIKPEDLQKFDGILLQKSYLVGHRATIADVLVFAAIHDQKLVDAAVGLVNIARWFDHIQNLVVSDVVPRKSIAHRAFVFPFLETAAAVAKTAEAVPAPPSAEKKKEEKADNKKAEEKGEKKPAEKKEKAEKAAAAPEKKADAPAAPPAAVVKATEESKPVSADGLDPSKLEIKVGLIVKCWNHPESDKLLCEEIDLGEGTTRTIASGLRAFYTAEQMQGRKVLVLANLKERPMAGFKSQGMVLCAIGEGHSVVKLLEPPATANVGDRVDIAGFVGEPAPAAQVAKKKIFESLAPFFRSDANGIPSWNNIPFTIKGEQCVATLTNAVIS